MKIMRSFLALFKAVVDLNGAWCMVHATVIRALETVDTVPKTGNGLLYAKLEKVFRKE